MRSEIPYGLIAFEAPSRGEIADAGRDARRRATRPAIEQFADDPIAFPAARPARHLGVDCDRLAASLGSSGSRADLRSSTARSASEASVASCIRRATRRSVASLASNVTMRRDASSQGRGTCLLPTPEEGSVDDGGKARRNGSLGERKNAPVNPPCDLRVQPASGPSGWRSVGRSRACACARRRWDADSAIVSTSDCETSSCRTRKPVGDDDRRARSRRNRGQRRDNHGTRRPGCRGHARWELTGAFAGHHCTHYRPIDEMEAQVRKPS